MSDLVRKQDVIDAVQNTVDPSIGIREDGSIFACCDSADVVRKISAISAVDAIPVEWIKERMNNIEDTMLEMAWSMLISDWEKRKE